MREAASFIASQTQLCGAGSAHVALAGGSRARSQAWNSRRKLATLADIDDHLLSDIGLDRERRPGRAGPALHAGSRRRAAAARRAQPREPLGHSERQGATCRCGCAEGSKRRRTCYRDSIERSPDAHRDCSRHPPRGLPPDRLPDRDGRSRHPPRARGGPRRLAPLRPAAPGHAAARAARPRRRRPGPEGPDARLPSCRRIPPTRRLPDRLTLHAPPAGPFDLEIVTETNPAANSALMGLYLSNGVYTTQCEAEGFRRITYFLDRPDVLSVYTTRIEARKARGADPARQRQPGRRGRHRRHRPPLRRLARPLPEALLPFRPRRRRARRHPRHLHDAVGPAR